MKIQYFTNFLLPYPLLIVLIFGMVVETAWIRKLHDNRLYDTTLKKKIFNRDLSNQVPAKNQNNEAEICTKLSVSNEEKANLNAKLSRRDLLDELEKIEKLLSTPRTYHVTESQSQQPANSYNQVTNSPVYPSKNPSFNSNSFTTNGLETITSNRPMPINQETINTPMSDSNPLQNKMNRNSNTDENEGTRIHIERLDKHHQFTQQPGSRKFYGNDLFGDPKDRNSDGNGKPGNNSISEVYGLAIKAERKYDESKEECGKVKFSEMNAELMSEMERMDRVGNVKFEDTENSSRSRDDQKQPFSMSAQRHSRAAPEFQTAMGSGSASDLPNTTPMNEVRSLRRAEAVRGDDDKEVGTDEDDADDDSDIVIPLVGNRHSALGRPSID